MNRTCSLLLLLLALLLTSAQVALAAAVSITPSGNGVFIISGSGMDAVAGVDLTVSYDATQLSSPAVTQGSLISGALMAVNTNKPGSIKIAAVSTSPFPASGQIATISFATHAGTGNVKVVSSMINTKGSPLPGGGESVASDYQTTVGTSPGFITTAGVPFSQPPPAITPPPPASTSAGGPALPGTISMQGDVQLKSDTKPAEISSLPTPAAESIPVIPSAPPEQPLPVRAPQKNEPVKMTSIKGTVENFGTFKGEKTPANLVALLKQQNSATIRQEPAFVLSDGKTAIKITAELQSVGEKSPNFALHGAKLVTLAADSASSTWTITALPHAGIGEASLTIMTDRDLIEFPFTVAPPVETVTNVEIDFTIFLKDSGATPPKRDLNSDGKHDYQDDYIYTINYLSKKSVANKPAK